MRVDFESCEYTEENNTCSPLRETWVCVIAAGWLPMFTIYTAGVDWQGTGESTTTTFDVFVEHVTHLDTERNEDEWSWIDSGLERCEKCGHFRYPHPRLDAVGWQDRVGHAEDCEDNKED